MTEEQIAAVEALEEAGYVHDRGPGDVIQEGLTFQWHDGPGLRAVFHARVRDVRIRFATMQNGEVQAELICDAAHVPVEVREYLERLATRRPAGQQPAD